MNTGALILKIEWWGTFQHFDSKQHCHAGRDFFCINLFLQSFGLVKQCFSSRKLNSSKSDF